jgi:2-C-methyl-D-erythritol 4-phosphate cytidylyltransferase
MGGTVPKQFLPLAGEPVLVHAARGFVGIAGLTRLVVVTTAAERERCHRLIAPLQLPVHFAEAGAERQQSVASGLAATEAGCAIIVVHDAVRPLVRPAQVAACIAAARVCGAALLAVPVPDTVKRVAQERVTATVPRADLWLAQTPQAFRADVLRRAHAAAAAAGVAATDDAALVERLGLPVAIVPGEARNRKLTTADDLVWAAAVLAAGHD